ncbi:MAG: hypothetical protein SVZ03_10390 [Spirochaetota bacterium]|nr:hypothetical protein [Spirochaetota bacterium]
MPDWILIIDRDRNKFFFDKNGKVRTLGEPEFEYKSVSIEGLDYYLNHGIELIHRHHKVDGLTLLKSIMTLPVTNHMIYEAKSRASREINYMKKKEGVRFEILSNRASLLLCRNDEITTLTNDRMLYSIKLPKGFRIINKNVREKPKYLYYGVSLGINLEGRDIDNSGYDLLLAIDSERFSAPIRSVKRLEANWRRILGSDTFIRKIIEVGKDKIVYSYRDKAHPNYAGIEGFYYKNRYGYFLKIICAGETFIKYRDRILMLVKSFHL